MFFTKTKPMAVLSLYPIFNPRDTKKKHRLEESWKVCAKPLNCPIIHVLLAAPGLLALGEH